MNGADEPRGASAFAQRMELAVAQWSAAVPPPLRAAFRDAFMKFADDHERALNTIEDIWTRRDRNYAFDESTGLARRKPFFDHLAALLSRGSGTGAVGVLFLDLNGLKSINDRCGHDAGDRAIAAAGQIIREAIRVDRHVDVLVRTIDDDFAVSRHGGDEFLIALELRQPDDIRIVAPRIKARVDDPVRQRACGYVALEPLTVSVGGVVCRRESTTLPTSAMVRDLIAKADCQMYASKRDGLVHIAVATFGDRIEIEREEACGQAGPAF